MRLADLFFFWFSTNSSSLGFHQFYQPFVFSLSFFLHSLSHSLSICPIFVRLRLALILDTWRNRDLSSFLFLLCLSWFSKTKTWAPNLIQKQRFMSLSREPSCVFKHATFIFLIAKPRILFVENRLKETQQQEGVMLAPFISFFFHA